MELAHVCFNSLFPLQLRRDARATLRSSMLKGGDGAKVPVKVVPNHLRCLW
jgi:hypothetical protein